MKLKLFAIFILIFSLPVTFATSQEIENSVPPADDGQEIPESSETPANEQQILQSSEAHDNFQELPESSETPDTSRKSFFQRADFFLELTPGFYINPSQELKGESASSIYPFSIGFHWPNDFWISAEPSLSFFTMYHLWDDGTAYPAEIENRTTQTFNFLLNLPVCFSISSKFGDLKFTPGIAILARFGILAHGLSDTENADVSQINKWFWQNARFLYLSFGTEYIFNLTANLRAGPVIQAALPLGSLFSGENVQGMMIKFGLKIIF